MFDNTSLLIKTETKKLDLNTHLHPQEGTVGPPGRGAMLVNGGRIDPSPAHTLLTAHTLRTCRTSLLPALTTASMYFQTSHLFNRYVFRCDIPFLDLEVLQYLSFTDSPELTRDIVSTCFVSFFDSLTRCRFDPQPTQTDWSTLRSGMNVSDKTLTLSYSKCAVPVQFVPNIWTTLTALGPGSWAFVPLCWPNMPLGNYLHSPLTAFLLFVIDCPP